jgi:RimJ/RimL family protein N-acetyltransferase
MAAMHIELGGDVVLRAFEPGDAPSLARHADNANIARWLRDRFPHPYTLADAESWIGFARSQVPMTNFAVVQDGEAIGGAGLTLLDDIWRRSAEIGFWLGEPFWGRGIMSRVVPALTEWAFQSFDLARVFATVFAGNDASARVLEKAGYACEGTLRQAACKDGVLLDLWLYARVLGAAR